MAELVRILLKPVKGEPMQEVSTAKMLSGHGLAGNAERGGPRQVTVLSVEDWETATDEVGAVLDPEVRRANLLVSGVGELAGSTGRVLRIGDARIEITGETKPCRFMDVAHEGLRVAMSGNWRGGLTAIALDDAVLAVGDEVCWEDSATS